MFPALEGAVFQWVLPLLLCHHPNISLYIPSAHFHTQAVPCPFSHLLLWGQPHSFPQCYGSSTCNVLLLLLLLCFFPLAVGPLTCCPFSSRITNQHFQLEKLMQLLPNPHSFSSSSSSWSEFPIPQILSCVILPHALNQPWISARCWGALQPPICCAAVGPAAGTGLRFLPQCPTSASEYKENAVHVLLEKK